MTVVLDTSALLYWTLDPTRLSARALDSIQTGDSIRISSISIWEIGIKVGRGRLTLPLPLRAFSEKLKLVEELEIIPVSEEIWIRNLELKWRHRDPADRTIVALAEMLDCPLVTSDRAIRRFYRQAVW